jgi:ankyrin repeat protein
MSRKRAWEVGSACVLAALLLVCAWTYYVGVELPRQLNERFSWAVEHEEFNEIRALARRGAKLNNHAGTTALVLAAWQGETDLAFELIELGASSKYVDRAVGQGTPLFLAVHYGHEDTVELLLKRTRPPKFELNEALGDVSWAGSVKLAKDLIHAGADWEKADLEDLLSTAQMRKSAELVEFFSHEIKRRRHRTKSASRLHGSGTR